MLRRMLAVWMGGASGACGFAALGVALYAPLQTQAAAMLFGGFGFAMGALCALLPSLRRRLPAHRHAELPGPALAGLVRATLATSAAAAEQPARSGTAADRRPAEVAAAALAAAATAASTTTPVKATPLAASAAAGNRRFASSSFGA